ncbi:MAG: hypothetical protein UW51_C0006G0191 [Candidatus Amesbacteria bacterium GW2011_GWA1_44_24]|nr:MAG: hypothetical protein UW51_C0006G0191 [Candidatus Amesbacteria bacterium GW2011_GWA1_44_24]
MNINNTITGSAWIKCDLHIHSPASYDYKDNSVTSQQIVDKLKKEKLELASITDHWSVGNIEEIRNLAKQGGITILPGFEFRVDKGNKPIHAAAIFPEDTDIQSIKDNVLNQLCLCEIEGKGINRSALVTLGKKRLEKGKTEEEYFREGLEHAYVDLKQARQVIRKNGGLVCLHYDKSSGLQEIDSTSGSQLKINIHQHADIFDLSKATTKEDSLKHPNVVKLTGGQTPGLIGSDAHTIGDIGLKYSWIKAKPTFNGLTQILYEPDTRVCLEKNCPRYIHYRLGSFLLEKGQDSNGKYCFQELSETVSFNPNLTTIIGSRGSGKSTLVELIAYVFDLHSRTAASEEIPSIVEYHQQQCPNLGVSLTVKSGEDEYQIKRALNQDAQSVSDSNALAISVDYWPQGKIEKIARDKNKVSNLMYEKLEKTELKELWEKIEDLLQQSERKRLGYVQIYKLVQDKSKINKELQEIELYFKKLNDQKFQDLYKRLQQLYRNKRTIEEYLSTLSQYSQKIANIKTNLTGLSKLNNNEIELLIPSLKGKLTNYDNLLRTSLESVERQLLVSEKAIKESPEYKRTTNDFVTAEAEYQKYCKEQGIHLTKEEVKAKRDRQATLEDLLKKTRESIEQSKKNKEDHGKIVEELSQTFKEWEKLNRSIIDEFNKSYSSSQISAVYEPDETGQIDWVIQQYADSYAEWKEICNDKIIGLEKFQEDYLREVLKEVFAKSSPITLLIDGLGKGTSPKPGSKFLDGVYKLKETSYLRDVLILRLKEYAIKGLNIVKYKDKPLESLSFGERCGTLLELVASSGNRPLIIDQPEDHIDTEFLTKRLIPLIKQKKEERQIILCTRDPNLVVLSDSELVIVLKDDDKDDITEQIVEGAIEEPGIEEYICNILEGGKDAFLKRERRYLLENLQQ